MSHISYRPRSERLAHGAKTARELAQYAQESSFRASVRFERPAFNRPAYEAAAVGVFAAVVYLAASLAIFGGF